jgi:hypothetical protein
MLKVRLECGPRRYRDTHYAGNRIGPLQDAPPPRGAIEHRYKADHVAHIDDEAWSQTPGLIKHRMATAVLEEIGRNVMEAAATGGFDRENGHLTRTRLVLDGEGWDVLADKLTELWKLAGELQEESDARLRESNHADERRAGLVMMLFESMPSATDEDWARVSATQAAGRQPGTRSALPPS